MTKRRDPYKTLGVKRTASEAEIKAAFRKKAAKAHPDRGGSAEEFDAVKKASTVLLDPNRRQQYDDVGITEDDPDMAAFVVISGLLSQALTGDTEPDQVPLIDQMIKFLGAEQGLIRDNMATLRRAIARSERVIKKLKRKKGEVCQLSGILRRQSMEAADQIVKCERDIVIRKRAAEILADYDFDFQQMSQMAMTMYVTR